MSISPSLSCPRSLRILQFTPPYPLASAARLRILGRMPSEDRNPTIEALIAETTESFRRAAGDSEHLKAAAFLFTNRSREIQLSDAKMAEVLGISIARAELSEKGGDLVLKHVEEIDSLIRNIPPTPPQTKPWWNIWS